MLASTSLMLIQVDVWSEKNRIIHSQVVTVNTTNMTLPITYHHPSASFSSSPTLSRTCSGGVSRSYASSSEIGDVCSTTFRYCLFVIQTRLSFSAFTCGLRVSCRRLTHAFPRRKQMKKAYVPRYQPKHTQFTL
jgi:hypothetical protein